MYHHNFVYVSKRNSQVKNAYSNALDLLHEAQKIIKEEHARVHERQNTINQAHREMLKQRNTEVSKTEQTILIYVCFLIIFIIFTMMMFIF